MLHQVTQHPAHGGLAGKLVKHQRNHRLSLAIRVLDDVARGPATVAHGDQHPQCAALGFGALPG